MKTEEKYKNQDFELLKINQERFASQELNNLINQVEGFYKKFNCEYSRYTSNYIATIRNIMNSFNIKNLISHDFGGELYLRGTAQEDITRIISIVNQYVNKLYELRYLYFLSEEKRNVVFVGPNGCGKTTLLRHLLNLTGEQDISYYQADRLLLIDTTYNPERDAKQFENTLISTYRSATNVETSDQGFYIKRQLNQIIALFEKTRASELEMILTGELKREESKTEFILKSWNDLIKDRLLYCNGTLKVKTLEGNEYELKYLSSGEKNIFYFLASIILQPEKKYYFIDEPENNLNPSIVAQLWNTIEKSRANSIFVYLTHDNEFVSTRINSKIYWIRKYDGKEWKYKALPENDNLPQPLMINLVGNRQSVIFCESENERKYDSIIFKLMFPTFKVISTGGCAKVIAKVKAYKEAGLPQHAFGIIDCDYRQQEYLDGQSKHNIFYMPFFEIENFLFCEEILCEIIKQYSQDAVNTFNNVLRAIKKDFIEKKERFVVRNVATRLHELGFSDGINKLTSRQELINKYNSFSTSVNLEDYFVKYDELFNDIIAKNDLNTFLRYYDNKNILSDFNKTLNFYDGVSYEDIVLPFLKDRADTLLVVLRKKYLNSINT